MVTRILLADDHTIFRESLRTLIEKSGTATVVGEAGDGAEAVRLAGELRPDLVVMDLTMPVMNGIDATRQIRDMYPAIKIMALSMEKDRFFVVEVLKAGAVGYLLKDTVFTEFAEAVESVVRGETYLPRKIASLVVQEFLQRIPEESSVVYQNLTRRERMILKLVADGKSIKEMAFELDISNKTVENLRQSVMQKLDLFSIAELTKYAVSHGMSPLTE